MRTCKTGPYNLSPGTEKCLVPLKNGRYEESEPAVLELLTLKDRQIDILSSHFSFSKGGENANGWIEEIFSQDFGKRVLGNW